MKENEIKIDLDGRIMIVPKDAYIKAKTGDLRNFGYASLTEKEVSEQVEKILKGEKLNVIGMFIEKDIIKPK